MPEPVNGPAHWDDPRYEVSVSFWYTTRLKACVPSVTYVVVDKTLIVKNITLSMFRVRCSG